MLNETNLAGLNESVVNAKKELERIIEKTKKTRDRQVLLNEALELQQNFSLLESRIQRITAEQLSTNETNEFELIGEIADFISENLPTTISILKNPQEKLDIPNLKAWRR